MISPPGPVAVRAAANARHGAAIEHAGLSTPAVETNDPLTGGEGRSAAHVDVHQQGDGEGGGMTIGRIMAIPLRPGMRAPRRGPYAAGQMRTMSYCSCV